MSAVYRPTQYQNNRGVYQQQAQTTTSYSYQERTYRDNNRSNYQQSDHQLGKRTYRDYND
jgi:hypothetical protein